MLEYKLDDSLYPALKDGKEFMASGAAAHGPIELIYSGIYRSEDTFNVITHLMTRWNGRVDDKRRQSVLVSSPLDSVQLPCSSGKFSLNGVNYFFNTMETICAMNDDSIHPSDIICSLLRGSFSTSTKKDFLRNFENYVSLVNAFYLRFYKKEGDSNKREAPEVILQFSRLDNRGAMEFEDVKNDHSKPSRFEKARMAYATAVDKEKPEQLPGRVLRKIYWKNIGGLFVAKRQIREFLDDFYDPETARSLGLDPSERGGILLFGETGNGKTLLAEAIATELAEKYGNGFVPFCIDYSHLASEFRGVETRKTCELFDLVNKTIGKNKKVLLFLDEFQKMGQRTTSPANRHINAVLDQMLIETSRFDYGNCILMAATAQEPYTIDQQLMRPGRFGTHIFCNNPTLEEASDILKKSVSMRVKKSKYRSEDLIAHKGINYKNLAKQAQGFTLADLYYLVIDVFKEKLQELRESGKVKPITINNFSKFIEDRRFTKSKTRSHEAII